MNILLVQPDMAFKRHHPLVFKGFAATIPLGIAYLAAYLEQDGHRVHVLDYQIADYDIAAELERIQPDVLGLSICSPAFTHAAALAREAKRALPELIIVAGGPHVTEYRDEVLRRCPELDLVVLGEGERTLPMLVERWSKGKGIEDVPGVLYRQDGDVVDTGPGRVISDLEELPMMPFHLFDVKKYHPLPGTFRRLPSVAMATSRGCPYHCTFCNSRGLFNKVRLRPPAAVADEVEFVVREYGAREIYFVDELFTAKRSNVMRFCEELLKRELRIGWKCCARVDSVDLEMLGLMKKSGCFMISYGVESGDDRILQIMKKGITTNQVRETFRITRDAGIARMAFFILNSYGETRRSVEKSLTLCREIRPDFVNFELFKPFPGIEMRKQIENDPDCRIDRAIWDDWEEFTVGNRIFYTQNDLDEAYLTRVYERAIKGFYLTPSFIARSLLNMKSYEQFKCYVKTFLNMITVRVLQN